VLVLQADLDSTVGIQCVRTVNRPVLRESACTVSVRIAAYGQQPKPGTGCDGEGDREAIRVRLHAPLGSRRLIDEVTGLTHPVLDPATVPTVSALPRTFTAELLRWEDSKGVAVRRGNSGTHDVWMTVGPLAQIERGAPLPSKTGGR
jgi:hypothetical protein